MMSLQELEEARRQNRDLHREKFSALSQAKENVEWEKQRQIEQMKEKLEKVRILIKKYSVQRNIQAPSSIVVLLYPTKLNVIIGTSENKVCH